MTETDKQKIIEELTQDIEEAKNDFNSNATSKLEEYNLNAENKIIEFNENASSYEERIETNAESIELLKQEKLELKAKDIELEEENERLREDLNNTVPSISGSGENVTLNDTAEARFKKFGIGGNSWQETGDVTDEEGNVIGVMSSPNYINPIKNVTGNANVTICNKNVFNLKGSEALYINGSADYEKDDTSIKVFTTYKEQWGCVYFSVGKIKNYIGKMITLSADVELFKSGQISSVSLCTIKGNGANKKEIKSKGSITQSGQIEITAEIKEVEDADFISFRIYANTSSDCEEGDYTILKNIQVEVSETKTTYEEHKDQSFAFPLSEGQRLMLGDYLADDGIHHKRKQIVLDGTESWGLYDNTNHIFCIAINNIKRSLCKCSHFKGIESGLTSTDYVCLVNNYGIYINNKNITGIENWKEYLAEQYANGTPLTVEYDLAEEEIEPYTPEQQAVYNEIKKTAHSYGEQTHIFSTDEISPIFTVEAKADIQAIFNNLQAQILAGEV